jgi:hypothetical protein
LLQAHYVHQEANHQLVTESQSQKTPKQDYAKKIRNFIDGDALMFETTVFKRAYLMQP